MNRIIEIRSYNLKPGTRYAYHKIVIEEAIPMLKRWNMDVVAFGPSPQDDNTYYLIRSFADLQDMEKSEDAFYGSEEWKQGPRAGIVGKIENYAAIVLNVDEATLKGLRQPGV